MTITDEQIKAVETCEMDATFRFSDGSELGMSFKNLNGHIAADIISLISSHSAPQAVRDVMGSNGDG